MKSKASKMKGIVGTRPADGVERTNRVVARLIEEYPDVWPKAVRSGKAHWRQMPTEQFDQALDAIKARRNR